MSAPTPLTIVGSTGLTGSAALRALLASPANFAITALTRRAHPQTAANPKTSYTNRVLADASEASSSPELLAAPGSVYVSCLGTTRADAGSVEAQKKIDYDLNLALATRAKKDGAKTVSRHGHSCASSVSQLLVDIVELFDPS